MYNFRRYLGTAEEKMARYYDGAWQKIIYVVLADKSLPAKNTFECEMLLPHTSIKEIKTIFYAPSKVSIEYLRKHINLLEYLCIRNEI